MDRIKTFFWRWGPALVVMGVIFIGSAQTKADLPDLGVWDWLAHKGAHLLSYALLAVAYLRGLALSTGRRPSLGLVAAAVLMAALYGATDEYHQLYSAGRGSSPLEVGVDTLGAITGLALLWAAQRLARRRAA